MTYQALYRKWRPKNFTEIVGQQHVTRTLQNALAAGRISHAYLFCGTRGTGKTTTAKVLARALNCTENSGPEPCNGCDNCLSIIEGRSMDVVEIDAASNRGIDEIRDLKEKINFSPSNGRYRVYIIDEVHMLTNEAFNALLKTLEEPPAHVIFVLATTEPHKVPVTILSRCQRFDFHPITLPDIIGRMEEVAAGANLEIEKDALEVIARAADGSLRDALSIMDQASSLGEGRITRDEIHRILGTVHEDVLGRMTGNLLAGDVAGAIRIIDALAAEGKDLHIFARQLGAYLRGLLVNGIVSSDENNGRAKRADRSLLLYITKLLVRYEQDMRWSSQPRLLLELFVFESIEGGGDDSPDDLALRLARLEERVEKLMEPGAGIDTGETFVTLAPGENKRETLNKKEIINKEKTVNKEDTVDKQPQREYFKRHEQQGNKNGKIGNNIVIEKAQNPSGVTPAAATIPLDRVRKLWPQILEAVKKESKAACAYLETSWPAGVSGYVLTLGYEEGDIAKDMMEQEINQKTLARVLKSFFKGDWTIRCEAGLNRPEAWEEGGREMDFNGVAEIFGAEEVDKKPPE